MKDRREQGREMYELGLKLGTLGPIVIGGAGGTLAQALMRSVGCGVVLSGGDARFHDGSCAACGVWLAGYYNLPAAVFIRQCAGWIDVSITDGQGKPLSCSEELGCAPCTGHWDWITGADGGWAARRAEKRSYGGVVAAEGPAALNLLLERMGCDVLSSPQAGVPVLKADKDGFRLRVEWNGKVFHPGGADALAAAARWLSEGRAIPAFHVELL